MPRFSPAPARVQPSTPNTPSAVDELIIAQGEQRYLKMSKRELAARLAQAEKKALDLLCF